MDPMWLLLLLPVAAGSGWLFGHRKPIANGGIAPDSLPSAYFRGLNFLLNEQHDKALEILVGALEQHDDTVDVQLALGTLFRRRGELERATAVHQNLVARDGLESEYRAQALFELAQDYYKAGLLDRAENYLLDVKGPHELEESANHLLLQIYDQEKEWDRALTVANALESARSDISLQGVIAQYFCEQAESAIGAGRYDDARSKIASALSADPDCVRALIQSGRLDALANAHRSAIATWERVVGLHPEFLGEVIGLVEQSFSMLDDRAAHREFLQRCLDLDHSNSRTLMAMIEFLVDYEGNEVASSYLEKCFNANPSLPALMRLIQFDPNADPRSTLAQPELIERIASELIDRNLGYACRRCGFRGRAMHWQCPGCRHWNTMSPRQSGHRET